MKSQKFAISILCLAALSCSAADNFDPSREAIKQKLRDPASAEFRNEAIRTLWSKGGQRLTVYCGEVNGANAFGGKTGFKPVQHVIDQRNLNENVKGIWPVGQVSIYDEGDSQNYYANCVRADTERGDEDFGKAILWFGDFSDADRAEIDKIVPVLSDRSAP